MRGTARPEATLTGVPHRATDHNARLGLWRRAKRFVFRTSVATSCRMTQPPVVASARCIRRRRVGPVQILRHHTTATGLCGKVGPCHTMLMGPLQARFRWGRPRAGVLSAGATVLTLGAVGLDPVIHSDASSGAAACLVSASYSLDGAKTKCNEVSNPTRQTLDCRFACGARRSVHGTLPLPATPRFAFHGPGVCGEPPKRCF